LGESGGKALRQVLGLIVRRQTALWRGWRPWAALVFLVIPLGILFGVVSKVLAYHSAIYLWLYSNYWSWTLVENAAYRQEFFHLITVSLIGCAALAVVAWSSGLALGFLSGGSVPVNGFLFCVLLFCGEFLYYSADAPKQVITIASGVFVLCKELLGWAPRSPLYELSVIGRDYLSANAVVFQGYFYRLVFPVMLQALLVLVPAVAGMRVSLHHRVSKQNHA
jgi:hypothetical protein